MPANDELLEALKRVSSWLACHVIASPEDMAQSFPGMLEDVEAAIAKAQAAQTRDEYEFVVWCGSEQVAGSSGEHDKALAEARHYATMYAQDGEGSIRIEEIIRIPVSLKEDA